MGVPALGPAGTAHAAQRLEAAPLVTPFSTAKPGTDLPPGWELLRLGPYKRPTQYAFVENDGTVVVHARAEGAASALLHPVKFDIRSAPIMQWRWKISGLIEGADNRVASKEDSPVRIVLGFDGDKSKLTLEERASAAIARRASGRDLPYAELIYIWSNRAPVGTVIENPHTHRIEMVVASTGGADAGGIGSTGPCDPDPKTGEPYGPTFPAVTPRDMARAQKAPARPPRREVPGARPRRFPRRHGGLGIHGGVPRAGPRRRAHRGRAADLTVGRGSQCGGPAGHRARPRLEGRPLLRRVRKGGSPSPARSP